MKILRYFDIKILSALFLGLVLVSQYHSILISKAVAQLSTPSGHLNTDIHASVGEYKLYLTGYQSPFASIVLTTSNGTFLASTTADAQGNFSFLGILIREGFSGFCLQAVDFRRVGESDVCLTIPPAAGDVTMNGIFLPPTVGLSQTQVGIGNTFKVFGYTMPNAIVTIHMGDGRTFTVTADNTGYYELEIDALTAGQFNIYATAEFQSNQSLTPTKFKQVTVLSLSKQGINWLERFWKWLLNLLGKLGPLIFVIPLLILIYILIRKLWPGLFPRIFGKKFAAEVPSDRRLHHWWFVGY